MNDTPRRAALVTGAAGGIGSAIARALAAEGVSVTLADVDDRGYAIAEAIGGRTRFVRLDVRSEEEWSRAIANAEADHGALSILVNNAGLIGPGLIESLDVASWQQVLDVNLTGTLLGMRAVLPSMRRAGGGSITNVSSTAGLVGYPNRAAYVASKWAVRGLTKTAALEFAPDNIRVNSVHPGPIRTRLTAGYSADTWLKQPIPRFGEAEEVAKLVSYIAFDATYSTASEFVVDGGLTAGTPLAIGS